VIASGGLEGFDLVFSHVDEEREIGRVPPETDFERFKREGISKEGRTLGELEEHEPLCVMLALFG
jgi:hypothetical protein